MGTRFKTILQKIIYTIYLASLVGFMEASQACFSKSDLSLIKNKYAKGFEIFQGKTFFLVKTKKQKILINYGKKKDCPGYLLVEAPVKKAVVTSTTHLAVLEMLDEHHSLVGFPDTKLITSSNIIQLVNQKKIINVDYPFNREKILLLKPDMILGYSAGVLDEESLSQLEKLNQLVILNDDFNEISLLGRAEWVKFVSLFYNKFKLAQKIFDDIEKSYNRTKDQVKNLKKPRVLIGQNNHGIWTAPGGESDIVKLIADAGGDYIWKDKKTKRTLQMSIEAVWSKLVDSEIWLTQNTWFSLKELKNSDDKYLKLNVLQTGRIYNHILKVNQWKNMNYWETGIMRPDLLIKDLVIIF
ncbi:MAG: hypothetical protein A2328_04980, partial [Bdellovibrionales bacterium RIFOXYB2_FULL_36_6]